jgi:hypothetical protein
MDFVATDGRLRPQTGHSCSLVNRWLWGRLLENRYPDRRARRFAWRRPHGFDLDSKRWNPRRAGLVAQPSSRNRSCHRQTEVLLVPVRRVTSIVPQPAAVSRTICVRPDRTAT